ncbi:hypothetical protein KFL_000730310 [Klebsormidium nitens]|uniref:Protein kinase-like domain containing protein n=1 Tax=Klebsormidium nitens TaxID=105231 RepID=A0A1Y1HRC9_KLENI|nr:hypothetical protein KFL_000730310 [Klebsormidium nitens]|eukprot:GAQ81195.1 hypothetical protein KFL_000730310 [Klebsormidium nitens]
MDWKQLCLEAGLSWSEKNLQDAGVSTTDVEPLIQVFKALGEYLELADRKEVLYDFHLKHLSALLKGGYEGVRDFVDARETDLEKCGLLPAKVGMLLRNQEKARSTLEQRQQRQQLYGQGAPPSKRQRVNVKERPSDFGSIKRAQLYLLKPHQSDTDELQQSKACFITGRPIVAPVRGALSAALLAPEFGIVLDACWRDFGNPTPFYFQQAHKLLALMRKLYPEERDRQLAYMEWHNETYPGLKIVLPGRSASASGPSPGSVEPSTDGRFAVPFVCGDKCAIVLEAKNELGACGDPHIQGLRYYQMLIGDGTQTDDYLEAMGHPALQIGLCGPYLDISAMYRLESNQVVLEPLTPLLSLTFDPLRQPAAMASLARVLMALGVAGWGLVQRLLKFAQPDVSWMQACQDQIKDQIKLDAETWAEGYEGSDCRKWFDFVQTAASDARALCSLRAAVGDLVPYPLWGQRFEELQLLHPGRNRLVYAATRVRDGVKEPVVIKLTSERYPAEVHRAWSDAEVAPKLYACDSLPGGCSSVVMERLGDRWSTLEVLAGEERQEVKEAAKEALARAHKLTVTVGSKTGIVVHGDARGPNIMVCRSGEGWAIRFIDFDWAGLHEVARYTSSLNPHHKWHPDAKQGAVMRQEHDEHLLHSI